MGDYKGEAKRKSEVCLIQKTQSRVAVFEGDPPYEWASVKFTCQESRFFPRLSRKKAVQSKTLVLAYLERAITYLT